MRISHTDFTGLGVEFQTKRGGKQGKRSCARPSLRRAGDRIERGSATSRALQAAKQLWEASKLHIARRLEKSRKQALDSCLLVVAGEAERDEAVVMWPDRAVVVGHGIVSRLPRRNRANAPAREKLWPQKILRHLRGAFGRSNPGEQDLTRI